MELIRISSDKIKISLSKAELDEYELTVDSMDGAAPKTQKAFRELFVCAREQTGFDTDGEKVFVQIFRAKGGGCEIFVSKVIKDEKSRSYVREERQAYIFAELTEMMNACRALERIGFRARSSAYRCDNGYCLIIFSPSELEHSYASEYGIKVETPPSEYMSEHFSVIKENDAVHTLALL